MVLKGDTLSLAEAARLLGVSPATLRRRVARGVVSAERDEANRLVFRRAGVLHGEPPDFSVVPSDPTYRPSPFLTSEERERGLAALARLRQRHARLLAERGAKPFTPSSQDLLDEVREERTRHLLG